MTRLFLLMIMLAVTAQNCLSQQADKDDYARAVRFTWDNINNKIAFQLQVTPGWFADSSGLWYAHHTREGKTHYQIDFSSLQKKPLLNHAKVAEKLGSRFKLQLDSSKLDLENIRCINQDTIEFNFKKKRFKWNTKTNSLEEVVPEKRNFNETKSPDGKWIAYTDNYNLYIRSTKTGEIKQLSSKGVKDYEYGSYYGWYDIIEHEGGDRPSRFYVSWSPDSKYIQTSICDLRYGRKMYLLDWSIDTLYRPKLLSYYRGSPGDTTVVHLIPVVFDIATGKEMRPDVPRIAHENGYSFEWSTKPGLGFLTYRERGFQKTHILKFDAGTSTTQHLLSDSSRTNIDGFEYWIAEKVNKIIFSSERSGWRQLYALDLKSKTVKPITSGAYYINDVLHIDQRGDGIVYFVASGKEAGKNPYQRYGYRISLNGKGLKLLTPEEGNHDLQLSPDKRFAVDNYSTAQTPTTTVLRELKTGKVLMQISKADISDLLAMNWPAPESFTALGADSKTTIYGMLWKPSNFNPSVKYPVIDHSYTGPHTHMVPRTFSRAVYLNNQALAELGFIVVMIDGHGSAGRSKAFHDVSYKRLGYALEDHIAAIRQLAAKNSWADTTRVGIFGHSAGGYDAAHALLQFPHFYKVAVSSSADHDHRMEKAWWPEMYMGWPVDSAYHHQSNITMASKLKGKLLIVHGGIDENVNPSASFKLAEMLIRADKPFDMLIMPSQRHTYLGIHQRYFLKTRWNYFVKHLLGKEPVWDFSLSEIQNANPVFQN